jgi:hypothetical protein
MFLFSQSWKGFSLWTLLKTGKRHIASKPRDIVNFRSKTCAFCNVYFEMFLTIFVSFKLNIYQCDTCIVSLEQICCILGKNLYNVITFEANLYLHSPITVGSRSTKTHLGTCFPAPVSLKKVLKESSPPPMVLSLGIWPSGWIPCSRQYNSQHALPIWTPAWPTWIEIHSRWKKN